VVLLPTGRASRGVGRTGVSKMPKELDPRIKVWADKIYESDRQKFGRLIKWISAAERTYEVIVIARTLESFVPYMASTVNWWAYLDRLLDLENGRYNARISEAQSDSHKTEVGELATALLNGISRRAKDH
jgi:hypothetical protein